MKVFVLNTKNLDVVDLPQKIEGIFWIRDLDKQNTPAIMIETREDKWVLKSNEIFQIIEQGNPISERTLELKKIYVIKSSEISKRINDDIARVYNMNLSLYHDKKTVPVRMINLKEVGKDYMATKKRKNKLLKILCCFGFLW